MNDDNDRGFWWGDTSHSVGQGAMALSTRGWLSVAERIKVGGGQSDTGDPSYSLHVVGTDTNANASYYTAVIDHNCSGGGTNTADRSHMALLIDMDSTATGGTTSNEHRMYGVRADVRHSGDSDIVYGVSSYSRSDHTSGQCTELRAMDAYALASGTGTNYNIFGINAMSIKDGGSTGTTTNMYGVRGEVEVDAGTCTNAYAMQSHIDRDGGTITNGYLYYGSYSGTVSTKWGIYLTGESKNYFSGSVGIGTTGPSQKLQVQNGHILMTGTWQAGNYYRLMGYNTAKQVQFSYNDGMWISDNNKILFGVGGTTGTGGVYTERMRIANNGNVGVNQSNPTYKMHVNGSMYYAGGGNYGSDDRIKYNEQNVSNALTLISQLQAQKYEKIVEVPRSAEGQWIPTDEEWENVKDEYEYDDEYGFIAQDVRNIPELSFLVTGEETRTDTKIISLEEYSNLATEQQNTYSLSYVNDESAVITPGEYSNLTSEESNSYSVGYTKQFETETPLGLNYNGIFVLAVAAIQELNSQLTSVLARLDALENPPS
jgi:hypothetical protein